MPMDLGTSSSDNREDKTAMKKLPIASAASLAAQQPVASPVTPSKDQEMILPPVDKEATAPRETNGGEKPPIHLVTTEPQEVNFQVQPDADKQPAVIQLIPAFDEGCPPGAAYIGGMLYVPLNPEGDELASPVATAIVIDGVSYVPYAEYMRRLNPSPADAKPVPPFFNIPTGQASLPPISSLSLDTMVTCIGNRGILHSWIGNTYHQSVGHLTGDSADQFLTHVNFVIAACTKLQAILEAFAAARDGADSEYTFFRNPFPGVHLDTYKGNEDGNGANLVALVEEIGKNCRGEGYEIEIESLCVEWVDTYGMLGFLFDVKSAALTGTKHVVKLPHFDAIVANQPKTAA